MFASLIGFSYGVYTFGDAVANAERHRQFADQLVTPVDRLLIETGSKESPEATTAQRRLYTMAASVESIDRIVGAGIAVFSLLGLVVAFLFERRHFPKEEPKSATGR
jgi:hypothetical protein